MTDPSSPIPSTTTGLRPFFTTIFLPTAIFGVGSGAGAPVLALLARDLGASVPVAGVIVALVALGAVIGDLPAGTLVARVGERNATLLGTAAGASGVLMSVLAPNPAILAVGALLTGAANAVWGLARQSYLAGALPFTMRARGISANAAMQRAGFLIGPFLGALVVHAVGARGGLVVQFVAIVAAGALIVVFPLPEAESVGTASTGVVAVMREHRPVLATLGVGTVLFGASRASRDVVLPLWAESIGVSPAAVSLVYGISSGVDLLLAYPAGILMDRYGRRATAVPALALFASAFLLLPLATGFGSFVAVAVVLGAANGLSNGLVMTLGADVSPVEGRAEFLAAWRLGHDTGAFAGPLTVGAVAAVSLSGGAVTVGVCALAGVVIMWRHIPRFVPPPKRTEKRTATVRVG